MNTDLKRLPPPISNPSSSMWIDEAIWGHRLYDEQTPWLVYLEFLNVLSHEIKKNRSFEEFQFNTLTYSPHKRLVLRTILFNNPKMENILKVSENDAERWRLWFEEMKKTPIVDNINFEYLKDHFHTFKDFWHIVSHIRSTSLEMNSNKRWTSKFVFPYGEDCLYEDLDKKGKTNDRRFFGRTGEMLYLMICRSKRKAELLSELQKKLLDPNVSYWNKIIKCLHPPDQNRNQSQRANSFLPYETHHCYDDITKDWLGILKLDMPGYDMLPHIVNLTGFHILKYMLEISNQIIENDRPVSMICEVVSPQKTFVREASWESYQKNNSLPQQAVERYIADIKVTEEWREAVENNDGFIYCYDILKKRVLWPQKKDEYNGPNTPDALISDLKSKALKRHRQHVGNIHRIYGKEIGIVSKRNTNRFRYAPTDNFLKSVIFTNVLKRMELNQFLEHIANRYGLIFGGQQAEQVLNSDDFDKKAFQSNTQRLEQRLFSLGLLRRLSDGCAYIINPYYSR